MYLFVSQETKESLIFFVPLANVCLCKQQKCMEITFFFFFFNLLGDAELINIVKTLQFFFSYTLAD